MVSEPQVLRHPGSAELLEEAGRYMPGGSLGAFFVPDGVAIVVSHGRGSKVYDMEGREYIDYVIGSGALVVGHAHPVVVEALQRRVEGGTHFSWLTEPTVALAKKMVSAIPCAEMVKFTSTGSEATFYALRLARAFTGREKIMRFESSYHGHHDYTQLGASAGIPRSIAASVITAPFNDLETTTQLIEQHRDELAAVIVEPMQRTIPPKPGFLHGLRALTKQYGIVLILDEVITGFRLAWGGAQERYGVVADLATYGKIIGGGHPVAAVAGRAEIMGLANPKKRGERYVMFSGTLSGNPLGTTAGLATLSVLEHAGTYERLIHIGEYLRRGLREIGASSRRPLLVTGDGPLVRIAFGSGDHLDPKAFAKGDQATLKALERELMLRGLLINLAGARFHLSLAHEDADLDRTLEIVDSAIRKVCADG